jgi:hypothetical protein
MSKPERSARILPTVIARELEAVCQARRGLIKGQRLGVISELVIAKLWRKRPTSALNIIEHSQSRFLVFFALIGMPFCLTNTISGDLAYFCVRIAEFIPYGFGNLKLLTMLLGKLVCGVLQCQL